MLRVGQRSWVFVPWRLGKGWTGLYESLVSALHAVSQALMIPVIIALLVLIVYTLYQVGTLIVEACKERREFDPSVVGLINRLEECGTDGVADEIASSNMLKRQREALLEVWENCVLPEDAVYAIAKRRIGSERGYYDTTIGRTDSVSRIGPMIGLMGTLIPLGPGIVALGSGDIETLANSLLVAFDTTVAGLLSAAICVVISRMRRKWYTAYMQSLEAVMTALLERIDAEREGRFQGIDGAERVGTYGDGRADKAVDAGSPRHAGYAAGASVGEAGRTMPISGADDADRTTLYTDVVYKGGPAYDSDWPAAGSSQSGSAADPKGA